MYLHRREDWARAGGALGKLVYSFDWTQTPLGPLEHWPQSLKTIVRVMLASRFAMWMSWGPELTFLYNDAYAKMTLATNIRGRWANLPTKFGRKFGKTLVRGLKEFLKPAKPPGTKLCFCSWSVADTVRKPTTRFPIVRCRMTTAKSRAIFAWSLKKRTVSSESVGSKHCGLWQRN